MADNIDDIPAGYKCGYISILGKPNVGKSTLLNQLLQQKISITSRKPQTTRCQVLGIQSDLNYQAIYIDTPGIQQDYDSPVHRHMTIEARSSMEGVDLVIFIIDAKKWTKEDEHVLNIIKNAGLNFFIVINKIDRVKPRSKLLPYMEKISTYINNNEIVPISAKTRENVDELKKIVFKLLPEGPPLYSDEHITNRNKKFFAAEFIREKLINRLGDELPYRITVTIEGFNEEPKIVMIKAIVWVEGKSQKNIVIGSEGKILKSVGEAARKDLQQLYQKKVFLQTWVKIKKNWSMSKESLQQLGFNDYIL